MKKTSFFDNDGKHKYAYFKVSAWVGGKESDPSAPQSLEMELFGSNTLVVSPDDSREAVRQEIEKITKELANGRISQFTNRRQAILFKPGNYDWLGFENGFYMHVAGLGFSPTETRIDRVSVNTNWLGGNNATCNFWRALENVTLLNHSGEFNYGVSQAAPLRRLKIQGKVNLDMGGWASGGYLANSLVTDTIGSVSQQQFFLRNNQLNYFQGVNWNLVSVGDVGTIEPKANRSIVNQTPVIYEKPFIYFSNGDYRVFLPARRENEKGTTWSDGKTEQGVSISLDRFYVARADIDNDATLNHQLQLGKHILFTPGIYQVSQPLQVNKPNIILLGLGLASIQPTAGNNAMEVDDVEGVRIAGLIFDAGSGVNPATSTGGSPVLLQVGKRGAQKDLSHNPIVLSDLFFRVGGVDTEEPCRADISVEINAHSTIGDHFWVWRADHGQQVAWELNRADYGLVVN
ncbi:MAG TPA: coagulation factor 5/8 type domain-containing protein, partial [Prolixibacteraceae bacterium]|nr:coagulation factor 5/8 type domain-containing protein [Prolixibacteraceae bacterium]